MAIIEEIIERIGELNPVHAKRLRKNLKSFDRDYFNKAEKFISDYESQLISEGHSREYWIDCYLKMIADVHHEYLKFLETGKYSSSSFEEVNKRVYDNPDVMEYYMHALLLSQFLWKHHYEIYEFFKQTISEHTSEIKSYLEVGAGHGFYISEAAQLLNSGTSLTVVDISESSISLAKKLAANPAIDFVHSDIFEFESDIKYDFIAMGEVLEHVEDPLALMKRLVEMVKDDGYIYITTPANAPAIDHIYLFEDAQDIRNILEEAGLEIVSEYSRYTEDLPEDKAKELKIALMYGALMKKK